MSAHLARGTKQGTTKVEVKGTNSGAPSIEVYINRFGGCWRDLFLAEWSISEAAFITMEELVKTKLKEMEKTLKRFSNLIYKYVFIYIYLH